MPSPSTLSSESHRPPTATSAEAARRQVAESQFASPASVRRRSSAARHRRPSCLQPTRRTRGRCRRRRRQCGESCPGPPPSWSRPARWRLPSSWWASSGPVLRPCRRYSGRRRHGMCGRRLWSEEEPRHAHRGRYQASTSTHGDETRPALS